MTTPQAVLDMITGLENDLKETNNEITQLGLRLAEAQLAQDQKRQAQVVILDQLDLLRFAVKKYDEHLAPQALVLEHPEEPAFAVIDAALAAMAARQDNSTAGITERSNPEEPGATKIRVANAMLWFNRPATATEIASAAGLPGYHSVAPCLAALKRDGKVKASPGRGWSLTK